MSISETTSISATASTSEEGPNTALILGLTIPIGILLLVALIALGVWGYLKYTAAAAAGDGERQRLLV